MKQYRQFNMLLSENRDITVVIPMYMRQSEYDYMLRVIDLQKDIIINSVEPEPEQEEKESEEE